MAEAGVARLRGHALARPDAPKGTPPAIVVKLNRELAKITSDPEVRRTWAAQGTAAMTMARRVRALSRRRHREVAQVVKVSGAKVE